MTARERAAFALAARWLRVKGRIMWNPPKEALTAMRLADATVPRPWLAERHEVAGTAESLSMDGVAVRG